MKISRKYVISAAHRLDNLSYPSKCSNVHGHNYTIEVTAEGPLNADDMVMDFTTLDHFVKPVLEPLDHADLNQVFKGIRTTCERMGLEILKNIKEEVIRHSEVLAVRLKFSLRIWESDRSFVTITEEDLVQGSE